MHTCPNCLNPSDQLCKKCLDFVSSPFLWGQCGLKDNQTSQTPKIFIGSGEDVDINMLINHDRQRTNKTVEAA